MPSPRNAGHLAVLGAFKAESPQPAHTKAVHGPPYNPCTPPVTPLKECSMLLIMPTTQDSQVQPHTTEDSPKNQWSPSSIARNSCAAGALGRQCTDPCHLAADCHRLSLPHGCHIGVNNVQQVMEEDVELVRIYSFA
jgi:hypothetical protein